VPKAGFRGQERAVQMDCEHLLPFAKRKLVDRLHDLNTGIADENVDRAEALKGCSNANFDSRFIADIHCDCHGATAGAINLVHGRLRRRQLQVRDHRAPPRKESQSNYRE